MDMTIIYGTGMFTAIILALVLVILSARSRLVAAPDLFTHSCLGETPVDSGCALAEPGRVYPYG